MNYLTAENLSKRYGDKILFQNFDISINKGQKIGLIARNGTGKSTLLHILAGQDSSDLGGMVRIHRDVRVGFLPQSPQFNPNETVLEAVVNTDNPILDVLRRYEAALLKQETGGNSPENQKNLDKAMEQVQALNAWDFEARIKEMLSRLGIKNLNQTMGNMSGGEQKRVALAAVLLKNPDLLIMDEPTNHLDLSMIEWLEEYLAKPSLTLFIVTHDRYFLDRITDEIIEIERGQAFRYKGNYSYYLEKKTELNTVFKAEQEKAQKLMKKELEWIRTQPQARGTKAKSRVDNFEKISEKARQKIYESDVDFELVKSEKIGGRAVELHYISKAYGQHVLLDNFHYFFSRNDRVGIVGGNGAGKTTFLNIITEKEKPDTGKVIVGQTVRFGYYTQAGLRLIADKKIIDIVRDVAEVLPLEKGKYLSAAQLLNHFQFPYSKHENYFSTLSGGEQRRLYLLTILMTNPNFLILDEPTNDLDLLTLNLLEEFLIHFKGCLLIVSHDRYFMDKLVDHVFVFEGKGKMRDFPGNYSQYRIARDAEIEAEREQQRLLNESKPQASSGSGRNAEREKSKLTFNEQREFAALEKEIPLLEKEKADLEVHLANPATTHSDLVKFSQRIGQLIEQIEQKTNRWLELSEWA